MSLPFHVGFFHLLVFTSQKTVEIFDGLAHEMKALHGKEALPGMKVRNDARGGRGGESQTGKRDTLECRLHEFIPKCHSLGLIPSD